MRDGRPPYPPEFDDPENWWVEFEDELREWDTRRWQWDRIDCCLSGKDADLDSYMMGIEIDRECSTDEVLAATVHTLVTFPGTDVCLNAPDTLTADEYDTRLQAYLEDAQEVVMGVGFPGEWSGDDWVLSAEFPIWVPVILKDDTPQVEDTVAEVLAQAHKAVERWDDEVALAHVAINLAAGWR